MITQSNYCPCWENFLSDHPCKSCAAELKKLLTPRNPHEAHTNNFKLYSMSNYEGRMREFIISSKNAAFNGLMPAQKKFLETICEYWHPEIAEYKVDLFIPVPGHPIRSFLQSDIAWYLARYLSKASNKGEPQSPLKRKLFVNNNLYLPQKHLTKIERSEKVRTQYFVNEKIKTPLKACLVDDVFTTGSTINTCKDMLINAGYEVPVAIVLSKVNDNRNFKTTLDSGKKYANPEFMMD